MGIYFVSNGESVKIGYTSGDAKSRMSQLQTGNACQLTLLAFNSDWDRAEESELHQQFANHRQSGEWFAMNDELKATILAINPKAFTKKKATAKQPEISVLKKSAIPATPDANEASTEACFDWYRELWTHRNSAKLFKMINYDDGFLDDAKESFAELKGFKDEGIEVLPWWFIEQDGKFYPELHSPTNKTGRKLIDGLCAVHGIDLYKLRYHSSDKLYPIFRRYLNPSFYNDRNWKAYSSHVKEMHGEEFVTQHPDTFECFVDCVVAWAWVTDDQPIARFMGTDDEKRFFNSIMPTPYRVKHIVENNVGFYCHTDDALAGFRKFCSDSSFEPTYDIQERTVSIKR